MLRKNDSEKAQQLRKLVGDENLLEFYEAPNAGPIAHDTAQTGTVSVFAADAPLTRQMLPKDFFFTTALFSLSGEPIPDEDACRKLCQKPGVARVVKELKEASGPSLEDTLYKNCLSDCCGMDRRKWNPSLGKRGFFSLSQEKKERFESTFVLAISCSHDILSEELLQHIGEKIDKHPATPYSLSNFLDSDRYHAADALAQRNVKRVAVKLADAMGIQLTNIRTDSVALGDLTYGAATADASLVRPLIAEPDSFTQFNHLTKGYYAGGEAIATQAAKPAIAIYSECGHPCHSFGSPILPLNPISGMMLVKGVESQELNQQTFTSDSMQKTLICGTGFTLDGEPPVRSKHLNVYVNRCLQFASETSAADPFENPKIKRSYRPVDGLVRMYRDSLPNAEPIVLDHVSSVVY